MQSKYLTRYTKETTVPDDTAEVQRDFIYVVHFLTHGAGDVLITDQGTTFTVKRVQCILDYSTKSYQKTGAYHTQTSRLTERINSPIKDGLAIYANAQPRTWAVIFS